MKRVIFAVKDLKAGVFTFEPMFAASRGVAERAFREQVNNPEMPISRWPGDYELWFLGEFDPMTGSLEPLPAPEFGVNGAQLVSKAVKAQLSLLDGLAANVGMGGGPVGDA